MPLAPRDYATGLLAEARETHPWLHHRLFRMHMEVEEEHGERAIQILSKIALTDKEQARGRLALRRAITVRRLCADGIYDAFVAEGRS